MASNDEAVIEETRKWLQSTVIGLNLCPFARAVYDAGRIRYVVSSATSAEALRARWPTNCACSRPSTPRRRRRP